MKDIAGVRNQATCVYSKVLLLRFWRELEFSANTKTDAIAIVIVVTEVGC
jgi:hypothetical protein